MDKYAEEKKELETFGFDDQTMDRLYRLVSLNNYHEHIKAQDELAAMGKEILPVMYTLMNSNSAILRKEAAKIMKLIADRTSIPVAIGMLEDSFGDIRWIAAETLIRIGRRSIRPLLKTIYKNSQSYFLREGAHHVLSELIREDDTNELKELRHILLNVSLLETIPLKTSMILKNKLV
jgi:HEAT repeat protein